MWGGGGDGTQAAMCKMTFIQVTIVDKRINNAFRIQAGQEMEIQAEVTAVKIIINDQQSTKSL